MAKQPILVRRRGGNERAQRRRHPLPVADHEEEEEHREDETDRRADCAEKYPPAHGREKLQHRARALRRPALYLRERDAESFLRPSERGTEYRHVAEIRERRCAVIRGEPLR